MRKVAFITVAIFLTTSFVPLAQAQSRPPAPTQESTKTQRPAQNHEEQKKVPRIVVHTNIVRVPVTVKDPTGKLVADLQSTDFRVFQDGVQQQIQKFSDEPFPISAVILLDDDLKTKDAQHVQASLDSISAGFGPNDEVAVVRFDEYPRLVLNFTSSNDALFAKLKQIRTNEKDALDSRTPGSFGFPMSAGARINGQPVTGPAIPDISHNSEGVTKHVDDAIHYAAEMLKDRGRDRRKIIFIISDGANDRHNQWSENLTLQLLLSNTISVYAIDVGDFLHLQSTGRLSQYSSSTGGDLVFASKAKDLERMYSEVTEEARNQYILAFEPTRTKGRGGYHTLEVRVERPNLAVLAPQGYFAEFPHN